MTSRLPKKTAMQKIRASALQTEVATVRRSRCAKPTGLVAETKAAAHFSNRFLIKMFKVVQSTVRASMASTSLRATAKLGTTARPAKPTSTTVRVRFAKMGGPALIKSTRSSATAKLDLAGTPARPTSTTVQVSPAPITALALTGLTRSSANVPTLGPAPTASYATEPTQTLRQTRPLPATV